IAHAGWRLLFIGFGVISLLWLIPWMIHTRTLSSALANKSTTAHANITEPSFRELLAKRQLWGASIGHFCSNYPFYFVLSWLPLYLVNSHGYSISGMARLCGAVYALAAVACLASGWLSDRWIASGTSTSRVRLTMICSVPVTWVFCMTACGLGSPRLVIAG